MSELLCRGASTFHLPDWANTPSDSHLTLVLLFFLIHRESNINFYVAEAATPVITAVKTLDDIGPEFNFTVKVCGIAMPRTTNHLQSSVWKSMWWETFCSKRSPQVFSLSASCTSPSLYRQQRKAETSSCTSSVSTQQWVKLFHTLPGERTHDVGVKGLMATSLKLVAAPPTGWFRQLWLKQPGGSTEDRREEPHRVLH